MKEITVKMGTERNSMQFPSDATIGQAVENQNMRAILGYGDNIRALIFGVEQDMGTVAPAGSVITVETKANTKNS
jgi:hypothetical protein